MAMNRQAALKVLLSNKDGNGFFSVGSTLKLYIEDPRPAENNN
jgi:hypothetical protein